MYRYLTAFFIVLFGLVIRSPAQICGPGCPVCSGTGASTGALLPSRSMVSTGIAIPNGEDETGVFNLRAGFTSWLDMGLGYAVKSEKLLWSIRLQPLSEDESSWRPAIVLGTGSVQTGGSDQSLFLQVTKAYEFSEQFSARFSLGMASLIPDLEKNYLLAGITLTVTENWSPFFSYDGINYHAGLSWIPFDWLFITGYLVEMKNPAILLGYRMSFNDKNQFGE